MRKYYLFFLFVSGTTVAWSQELPLLTEGSIVFERKINLFAGREISSEYKLQNSQFRTTYYQLQFTRNYSSYTPSAQNDQLNRVGIQPAENNIVNLDLREKTYQSTKKIFDEKFIVEDTIPRIAWKITSEKRTIAGFECRRANALIFDSVFIVAFYTDDIPVNAGPELFGGLPGMILGVSLPHLHINIFATQVAGHHINESLLVKKKPNQLPVSSRELKEALMISSRSWGGNAFLYLIQSLL